LPSEEGSVLKHLKIAIPGINLPWLYVGMLFSSFCWHNEDNYLYSINYSHKGAPKQWYGVSGEKARLFEKVSKEFLYESFQESPDLLQHMTTQISPSRLLTKHVPVYSLIQDEKTFVITFPKAFHAGFSYGFNVGEAVNFASPDWLRHGSEAEDRYQAIGRPSVFSHNRLLFTICNHLKNLKSADGFSKKTLEDMVSGLSLFLDAEITDRKNITLSGIRDISNVVKLPRNEFEVIDQNCVDYDDMRTCCVCKQYCIFTAVACECSQSKISCFKHYQSLCRCDVSRKYALYWASQGDLEETKAAMARAVTNFSKLAAMEGSQDGRPDTSRFSS
jgi:histone demethylase JARID1